MLLRAYLSDRVPLFGAHAAKATWCWPVCVGAVDVGGARRSERAHWRLARRPGAAQRGHARRPRGDRGGLTEIGKRHATAGVHGRHATSCCQDLAGWAAWRKNVAHRAAVTAGQRFLGSGSAHDRAASRTTGLAPSERCATGCWASMPRGTLTRIPVSARRRLFCAPRSNRGTACAGVRERAPPAARHALPRCPADESNDVPVDVGTIRDSGRRSGAMLSVRHAGRLPLRHVVAPGSSAVTGRLRDSWRSGLAMRARADETTLELIAPQTGRCALATVGSVHRASTTARSRRAASERRSAVVLTGSARPAPSSQTARASTTFSVRSASRRPSAAWPGSAPARRLAAISRRVTATPRRVVSVGRRRRLTATSRCGGRRGRSRRSARRRGSPPRRSTRRPSRRCGWRRGRPCRCGPSPGRRR